jgi:F420-dependent oxidoreductase-like protein
VKLGLNAMKTSVSFGYWGSPTATVEAIQLAESFGYHSVWTSEAYSTDAVVPLAWIAANTTKIELGTAAMQMAGRSPAMTAMTAVTLDKISHGRFILGLGISGARVTEGWHNMAFNRPLEHTREYVAVVRQVLARDEPVRFEGSHYQLPYRGPGSSGDGTPMKLMTRPHRSHIPIYIAATGERNVALAREIADGVISTFVSAAGVREIADDGVDGDDHAKRFEVAVMVPIQLGDDVDKCRRAVKQVVAFYVGGMGSRDRNYYRDQISRLGYDDDARRVQELYLAGKTAEAVASIPDELVDEIALCGPAGRIAERVEAWRESRATLLILSGATREAIELMAKLVL